MGLPTRNPSFRSGQCQAEAWHAEQKLRPTAEASGKRRKRSGANINDKLLGSAAQDGSFEITAPEEARELTAEEEAVAEELSAYRPRHHRCRERRRSILVREACA